MKNLGSVKEVHEFVGRVSEEARAWRTARQEKRKEDEHTAIAWLPWFRGEPSTKLATPLRPALYRRTVKDDKALRLLLEREGELRLEFKRCVPQLLDLGQSLPKKWDRYFLMQHFKAPTRLLDWTDGALVALYFAIRDRGSKDDKHNGAPAAVYMLDPWWLNEMAFREVSLVSEECHPVGVALADWKDVKPYLPREFDNDELGVKCPLAIDPSHISRRIAAQGSRFTVFGREPDGLTEKGKPDEARLGRMEISVENVDQMQADLRTCGVSESTIYPDLEGLGRELGYLLNLDIRRTEKLSDGADME